MKSRTFIAFLARAAELNLWLSIEEMGRELNLNAHLVGSRLQYARRCGYEIERRRSHRMHEYLLKGKKKL